MTPELSSKLKSDTMRLARAHLDLDFFSFPGAY
jgi:hypothetical protein